MYHPARDFAEFETQDVTLSVVNPERMGVEKSPPTPTTSPCRWSWPPARVRSPSAVTPMGDTFDTGVCHMAFFTDPDGNALMLHRAAGHRGLSAVG